MNSIDIQIGYGLDTCPVCGCPFEGHEQTRACVLEEDKRLRRQLSHERFERARIAMLAAIDARFLAREEARRLEWRGRNPRKQVQWG